MTNELSRAFVSDIEVRSDGTGRTVHGIIVPFDRVARVSDGGPSYNEGFRFGAFTRTIQHRGDRVKLLSQHNSRTNPLGRATLLREDRGSGLYGEFHVSKTAAGDEVLELLRDGALDSFSVGFAPMKHERVEDTTWRTEVGLREASLVTFPAYDGALVGGVRALDLTPQDLVELARMLREVDIAAATPDSDPAAAGTSPDGELAAEQDPTAGHSDRHHTKFTFGAELRQRGVL